VTLALAAGRIASAQDRQELERHFRRKGWLLFDDGWLRCCLTKSCEVGYEDDVVSIVAKLMSRHRVVSEQELPRQ
jgi:hypothetical protein